MLSIFWIFALYGSWEAGNSLKIVSRGVGTFSTIEHAILRTFILLFLFSDLPNLPPIPQLGSKKCPCQGPILKPDPSRKMRNEILCREMP